MNEIATTIWGEMAARLDSPLLREGLGARGVSLVQKNILRGNWAPNAPLTRAVKGDRAKPLLDYGHLIASFGHRSEGGLVIVATNRPGADVLHDGGTIRPTTTKFLTIPSGRQTKTLMRRYGLTPRTCIEGLKRAGYEVFFRVSKGGKSGAVFYRPKRPKDAEPIMIFVLKTEVTVPARPYLRLPQESLDILGRYLLRHTMEG